MQTEPTSTSAAARASAGKYLTFRLGQESYGVAVIKIREIIRFQDITSIPQMPPYVKGVINLRGKVIPVIDLRARFGLPHTDVTERTCIVVVQVDLPGGATWMGLIVDAVEEVLTIAQGDIENTPDFGMKLAMDYILGMAKIKGAVKTLLDIDRVIAAETIQIIQQAVPGK